MGFSSKGLTWSSFAHLQVWCKPQLFFGSCGYCVNLHCRSESLIFVNLPYNLFSLTLLFGCYSRVLLILFFFKAQPQRLPQPNALPLEKCKEETGKLRHDHAVLSNGGGIHNGIKLVAADSRKCSAPVSQKVHRKIQSSLSVNSESSKKSSAYSHKPGSSPEGKLKPYKKSQHRKHILTNNSTIN